MPASGKGAAVTLLSSQFEYFWAVFSPDAKWMAYTSSESGNFEVYAMPIQLEPAPRVIGEKRRISATGGWRPRWRPDGRELYYLSADNHLMSVAVNSYQFAQPKALFRLRSPSSPSSSLHGGYDISPDGQRFLIDTMLPGGTPPFNVVVNWQLLLKNPGQ